MCYRKEVGCGKKKKKIHIYYTASDSRVLSYRAVIFFFIKAISGRLVTKVFSLVHSSAGKLGVPSDFEERRSVAGISLSLLVHV